MASPTLPLQDLPILESIACTFIEIHLDAVAKRDLAIWFAEHPNSPCAKYELCQHLDHHRTAIDRGLRALQEAGAIVPARAEGHPAWQLTSDTATRQILQAVARYFRKHPDMRTVITHYEPA
ncbi:MAG: hypothetical protein HY872_05025 [Chloroflexi bacterium]|nr:hypothetical protein [Chloroflexota bacterium]